MDGVGGGEADTLPDADGAAETDGEGPTESVAEGVCAPLSDPRGVAEAVALPRALLLDPGERDAAVAELMGDRDSVGVGGAVPQLLGEGASVSVARVLGVAFSVWSAESVASGVGVWLPEGRMDAVGRGVRVRL